MKETGTEDNRSSFRNTAVYAVPCTDHTEYDTKCRPRHMQAVFLRLRGNPPAGIYRESIRKRGE